MARNWADREALGEQERLWQLGTAWGDPGRRANNPNQGIQQRTGNHAQITQMDPYKTGHEQIPNRNKIPNPIDLIFPQIKDVWLDIFDSCDHEECSW
jgi:hypothetical protein